MQTGQTLRGATRLGFDAVESVTDIVEGMYRNIAAAPLPFGAEPQGRARGIAGFVHQTIRVVNGGLRDATDFGRKRTVDRGPGFQAVDHVLYRILHR